MQTELLQVPCPEQIGCPGQTFDTICISNVVIVVEMIVIVCVRLNVVTAVSMVTVSDCLRLKMHADRKLLSTPTVAIPGLPVNYLRIHTHNTINVFISS